MTKIHALFSSSKGCCTYIGNAAGGILIDAGGSRKQIIEGLKAIGVTPSQIGAVFITHEHSDHISGLRVFCEQTGTPVFLSRGTKRGLQSRYPSTLTGKMDVSVFADKPVEANGFLVESFHTSHDTVDPRGFRITDMQGNTFAVCTDTGIVTNDTRAALRGVGCVMIESNHDIQMLRNSTTKDYGTKRRVLSDVGHLSNDACAAYLPELIEGGTTRIILAHLSPDDNRPEIAVDCAETALRTVGARRGSDYELWVAGYVQTPVMV
ncbi:MAG: MBL fold metallo-hydrolase [Oscillospiraceae bacterium]|jgi:phosphoribosyl 1,2-cyclic phosphodiesterase|nr:MBL fold metallo-hydrolase [Oscillospiraceae bacterium]